MGAFSQDLSVATAITVLMESAPKPNSSISPISLTIQIKFDQDWPTDLGDSIITLIENLIRPQRQVIPK